MKKLSNADSTPNYDANPPFSTSTLQKDRNSRSTSFELCWLGRRRRHRFPQSNRRFPTRSIHMYPTHRRPLRNDWSLISYFCTSSLLPAEEWFGFIQVHIKRHWWYSTPKISILLYSLWVGDDSKVSPSILMTTTPSACECLNIYQNIRIAMLFSMVPVTLPDTGSCPFYFTIGRYNRV